MKHVLFTLLAAILLSSCGSKEVVTKGDRYAGIYNENPHSLLIMPPINRTEDVEAKDQMYTSIARPLGECGYYIIPPQMSMDVLKQESAYDAEEFIDKPLNKFHELFGADAVVFTEIKKWKKRAVVAPIIDVEVRYIIKSTKTNEIIFDRECYTEIDLSVESSGGLLGFVVAKAIQIANTAKTDKVVAARLANYLVFRDLPHGDYSPKHGKDKENSSESPKVSGTCKLSEIPNESVLFVGGYTLEDNVQRQK